MYANRQWLERVQEDAFDPDLPICDPHHHFFADSTRYVTYMPPDARKDMVGPHRIMETVFVECREGYRRSGPESMKPVGETEFVVELVAGQPDETPLLAAGIVGHADLTLGANVAEVLEAHLAAAPGRFKGIRHATAYAPDRQSYGSSPPNLLHDRDFRAGFACLAQYGLTFDALIYAHQMADLANLAAAFPGTTIVLDHIGMPLNVGGPAQEVAQAWRDGITELAQRPNVVVKLGGLGMTQSGFGWHAQVTPPDSETLAEQTAPFYLWCVEHFGVERCMFESNFPVDQVSYSYSVLWNSFQRMTAGFSWAERVALFRGTALRVYGLEMHDNRRLAHD
ncbi:MAG: amidohydrolase family protein [Caldilineaceae bacterium]|nr:amidohydrolase family protein [Caldilineaceae bacterium]